MSITIDLSAEMERKLRAQTPDLEADVKRAYAIELFRRRRLNHHELTAILGLDRFETGALLKHHGVVGGSLTSADIDDDRATLDRVIGPISR